MNKKMILLSILVIILLVALSLPPIFHVKEQTSIKENAAEICIKACKEAMISGVDLLNGPCLLNPINEMPDWVCDVVNSPRQWVDDLPENQCSAFREGRAKHFVEVSIKCELVRAV
ncbi:MAG: hypothetical protein RMJ18_03150 [Candidatus Aenigmarchaeota archaeon]|nr:hypothetical protein [Candidatus Aenigmarchaeota archaeon]MDW8160385.1 hypothetical protein [Candidatus Aenigmarchaeota archaeon]